MNKKTKLSLLVCTLEDRSDYLTRLLGVLDPQVEGTSEVELLIEKDEGQKTIGEKRNTLLRKASGEYVAFIDDDDIVSSDYVEKIIKALESDPDVIGMNLLYFVDSNFTGISYHSLSYDSWFENQDKSTGLMRYYRNPNHLNPVKRELALKAGFPEISMGEDRAYSAKLLEHIKQEKYIIEPIYYYFFRSVK